MCGTWRMSAFRNRFPTDAQSSGATPYAITEGEKISWCCAQLIFILNLRTHRSKT